MSTELLTNTVLSGIVYFSHMYNKRPAKQSAAQSLSSLTLQEDEWWDLKTLGIGLALFSLKLTVKLPSVLEATNLHVFKAHLDKYREDKSICGLLNTMSLSAVVN